jgi:hypothetical protein
MPRPLQVRSCCPGRRSRLRCRSCPRCRGWNPSAAAKRKPRRDPPSRILSADSAPRAVARVFVSVRRCAAGRERGTAVFKEEAGGGGGFFYEARRCVAGWWGRAGPRVAVLGSRDHLDTGFAQRVLAFSFLPLFSIFFSGVLFFYWKNPECRPYTRPSGSCRFLDSTVADDFTYAGDARVTGARAPRCGSQQMQRLSFAPDACCEREPPAWEGSL